MPSQTGSIDLTAQVSANNNAKDYSDNVVDNLEIGGRNLFVNGSASDGYPTDAAVGNTYGITNMSANHEAYEKIPVEEDSSYVVQYWVDDSVHAGWVCIQLLDSSDVIKNKICRTYPAADYWTTTIDIPTGVSQMLVSGRHLASGYAYAKIKVEKGNKATDWTPAPEDQEAFSISSGVEYIEGTQSAATNLWTGVTKESSLVSGKTISYKLPFAGNSSAATLNLTLSDGSTTGAKAVKQIYTNASNTGALADITTHWPVGSVIPMTYDGTRWIVQNYNTNVDHYDRIQHNNTLKSATEKATGKNYAIVVSSLIGYISSLSGYQTILGGSIVDISKPLLWGTGNVNVSTTFTNAYEIYPSQTVRNNAGGSWTGTTFSMVYLFGTLNGTNLTVDSTVFTCTIPTTEDGKVYIPIGILYSEYQISFRTTSDIYAYKDGEFGKLSLREASAASKTATNYITADSSGIKIHMAGNSSTYQRQTSDSTTFYVGDKKRSQVGADGLHVYVDSTEDEVAHFGATARIGYTDDFRTVIGPGRINMLDGTKRLIGIAGGKIKMGQYGSFEVTDTGFNGYGRDGSKYVSLAVNGTGSVKHFVANIEVSSGETFYGYSFPTAQTHTQNLVISVDGVELVENADYTYRETVPSTVLVDGAYVQEGGNMGIITLLNPVAGPIMVTVEYDREVYGYEMQLGPNEYTNFSVNEDEATFTSKDGSRVSFDYHSLRMVDKDDNSYFYISDRRDESGTVFVENSEYGTGSKVYFGLRVQADSSTIEVFLNGSKITSGYSVRNMETTMEEDTDWFIHFKGVYKVGVKFDNAPANGAIVLLKGYVTDPEIAKDMKAITFGTRSSGSLGAISSVFGLDNEASMRCSEAHGEGTISDGNHTFSIGRFNTRNPGPKSISEVVQGAHIAAFVIGNGTSNSNRSTAALIDWKGNYIGQGMAGMIQMFAGSTAPRGWLICDGSAVSRTGYATLFAAIGTTWGSGDGSTTFNIPDLRGRMPIGAGVGSGLTSRTLGGKGGSEYIQAHTHAFTQPTVKTTLKYEKNVASGSDKNRVTGGTDTTYDTTSVYTASVSGGAVGAVSGATTGTSGNMPPFAVVNFIICTGKTS